MRRMMEDGDGWSRKVEDGVGWRLAAWSVCSDGRGMAEGWQGMHCGLEQTRIET